jgi:hypothetical protein
VPAFDVPEHVDDDVGTLRTLASMLAPAGQIVLTVPAYAWRWGGEDVISQHRRRYTMRSLVRAVRAAALRVRFASYVNAAILPGVAAVVWSRRLFHRDWATRTNLDAGGGWLAPALRAVTAWEARWVGSERLRLPAGASLIARLSASDGTPA